MDELYSYPENDYRNYLMHWGKGKESKNHKYISRFMGKNKKWQYIYPEDLKNGAKNLLNKFTGKGKVEAEDISEEEVQDTTTEETATSSQSKSGLLSRFTALLGKNNSGNTQGNKAKQNGFSALKNKVSNALKKPIALNKPKKSLESHLGSLMKTKTKVAKTLSNSISAFKQSKLGKVSKQADSAGKSKLAKSISGRLNKAKSKLVGASSGSNDPRPAGDASMDHSKSNKKELRSYLLSVGVHLATGNKVSLITKDVVRGLEAAKSVKRNKEVEEVRSKSKIDEKTGLHLKSKESSKLEDMAMVNPEYKNFDTNTKNNCMLCTTAYDLRRRGYEVSAKKASYGYQEADVVRWYKGGEVEECSIANDLSKQARRQHARNTIDYVKQQGDGARGNLMVYWTTGGGHSMAYEIENGQVVIYDCQSNKTYKGSSVEKLLSNTVYSECMRLDNLEVDWDYIKEAVR